MQQPSDTNLQASPRFWPSPNLSVPKPMWHPRVVKVSLGSNPDRGAVKNSFQEGPHIHMTHTHSKNHAGQVGSAFGHNGLCNHCNLPGLTFLSVWAQASTCLQILWSANTHHYEYEQDLAPPLQPSFTTPKAVGSKTPVINASLADLTCICTLLHDASPTKARIIQTQQRVQLVDGLNRRIIKWQPDHMLHEAPFSLTDILSFGGI